MGHVQSPTRLANKMKQQSPLLSPPPFPPRPGRRVSKEINQFVSWTGFMDSISSAVFQSPSTLFVPCPTHPPTYLAYYEVVGLGLLPAHPPPFLSSSERTSIPASAPLLVWILSVTGFLILSALAT